MIGFLADCVALQLCHWWGEGVGGENIVEGWDNGEIAQKRGRAFEHGVLQTQMVRSEKASNSRLGHRCIS